MSVYPYILVSSIKDAEDFYNNLLSMTKKGLSRNKGLKMMGKDLTSFERIKHIIALKKTRPQRFNEVIKF